MMWQGRFRKKYFRGIWGKNMPVLRDGVFDKVEFSGGLAISVQDADQRMLAGAWSEHSPHWFSRFL